jgi:hypothetical protein
MSGGFGPCHFDSGRRGLQKAQNPSVSAERRLGKRRSDRIGDEMVFEFREDLTEYESLWTPDLLLLRGFPLRASREAYAQRGATPYGICDLAQ